VAPELLCVLAEYCYPSQSDREGGAILESEFSSSVMMFIALYNFI